MNAERNQGADAAAGELPIPLDDLRAELSRIHHRINNPLSVISGNVELLTELARALGVQEDLGESLADIREALEQIAEATDQLTVTRRLLSPSRD